MLPPIKITEVLLEVDEWTSFSNEFTHIKNDDIAKDRHLLFTAILSDGINLGLRKMADSCPGTTYSRLSRLQACHIRDETYTSALGVLTNAQLSSDFAQNWGNGITSSSDGQRFKAGNRAEKIGHINPKYGSEPERLIYTFPKNHISFVKLACCTICTIFARFPRYYIFWVWYYTRISDQYRCLRSNWQ